ncbi:MAG: hypothetical protein ACFCU6_09305 [Balneolaceae bacterium]
MCKLFKISVSLYLFSLACHLIFTGDQVYSIFETDEIGYVAPWQQSDDHSSTFIFQQPYLSFVEIENNFNSEIDPRKFTSVYWTSGQQTHVQRLLYFYRSKSIFISQSTRKLIYPFHSYL